MNDDIRSILLHALAAPSVQNCQPWRWRVRGTTLELWKVPERDCVDINYEIPEAQYVAFGAALENVALAASAQGYRAAISYFPDSADERFIASVDLVKDASIAPDPLVQVIFSRATNRKPYHPVPLSPHETEALLQAGGAALRLVYDRASVHQLANCAAVYDEIHFSNKNVHYFLYAHINWTKEDEQRSGSGFSLAALEAGKRLWLLRLFRNWTTARLGALLGFPAYARRFFRRNYASSAAFCAILMNDTSPQAWLDVGRQVERVWLTATALGLQVQPTTGALFASIAARREGRGGFTPAQVARLARSYGTMQEIFTLPENMSLGFLFRLGHGEPPTGRNPRLPFESTVEVLSSQ